MIFTIDDIKELATSQSFQRGTTYFNSRAVGQIVVTGNLYEAQVEGSEDYNVSLDLANGELDFECDCPYNFDGICKHCVALGLAVLDDSHKKKNIPMNLVTENTPSESFSDCFKRIDDKVKLLFLTEVLERDSNLQKQFIAFVPVLATNSQNNDVNEIDIEALAAEIYGEICDIDFDNFDEDDNHYYSYHDDYNDNAAEDLIESVLDLYFDSVLNLLKDACLLNSVQYLYALYIGTQNLPEPDDEHDVLYDSLDNILKDQINAFISKYVSQISLVVLSNESVISTIDFIVDCKTKHENELKSENVSKINFDLTDFSEIFISLLINREIAVYLMQKINDFKLDNPRFAKVVLKIADLSENLELWLETAELHSVSNESISKLLLERYYNDKQNTNFYRVACHAFEKWPNQFDNYLYANLNQEEHLDLYIAVLANLASRECKIKYYNELKVYFTASQKNKFITQLYNSYKYGFYIQVLELEKRYDEILEFVRKSTLNDSLDEYIGPILNIYPEECFLILSEKIKAYLTIVGRNRNTYILMVKLMKLLLLIKTKSKETDLFLRFVFAHRLPALRDEMVKAKLASK